MKIEHDVRASGFHRLETLVQDMRYSLRVLRRTPGFTAVAILTLALGIGANTAIFSIVDSLLLRPLPVKNPEQLMVLAFRQGNGPLNTQFSVADLRDIRAQSTDAFSDMIGYAISLDGISMGGKADRALTNYVTGNFFSMLGLKPYAGRFFLPSEGQTFGADPVAVLSYSFWRTRFRGDPAIIGKRILVNGHPCVVVGIAPQAFHGLYPAPGVEAYFPFAMVESFEPGWPKDLMTNRILQNLYVLARARPGISLRRAGTLLDLIAQRLSTQHPETDKGLVLSVYAERFARPDPSMASTLIKAAVLFLALVALVLMLACANIANLQLVRASTREREMAVRAALGAARSRLIRQWLTESILLALIGGAAGLLLGLWATYSIGSIDLRNTIPFPFVFGFDWRVFAYSLGAALLTGVLMGLLPGLHAPGAHIAATLRESGRGIAGGRNHLRAGLVIVQVAVSLMLLVIAGLFMRSLAAAQRMNLGFDPHNIVEFTMDPSEIGYGEAQGLAFYRSLLDRVRALPGVQSASLSSSLPMSNYTSTDYLKISDYQNLPGQALPLVSYAVVSSDYFKTMRIPFLQGRSFSAADKQGAPYVAVVSEAFAKRFWPHQNPIGKNFAKLSGATNPTYEVVGVAGDCHFADVAGVVGAFFYLPIDQNYVLSSLQTLQVRSDIPASEMIVETKDTLRSIAPDLPLFDVQTMMEGLDSLSGFLVFQLAAGLAAGLGLLGLALAMVGVYGVISYSASQRTHEIGIRMALGAQRAAILRMMLSQGLAIVAAGLLFGCAAAFAGARLIGNLLVGVSPGDPLTYSMVTLILAGVALVACYIPARRAMKTDPIIALRHE